MGGGDERHADGAAGSHMSRHPLRAGARLTGTTPAEEYPDIPVAVGRDLIVPRDLLPVIQIFDGVLIRQPGK